MDSFGPIPSHYARESGLGPIPSGRPLPEPVPISVRAVVAAGRELVRILVALATPLERVDRTVQQDQPAIPPPQSIPPTAMSIEAKM